MKKNNDFIWFLDENDLILPILNNTDQIKNNNCDQIKFQNCLIYHQILSHQTKKNRITFTSLQFNSVVFFVVWCVPAIDPNALSTNQIDCNLFPFLLSPPQPLDTEGKRDICRLNYEVINQLIQSFHINFMWIYSY